MADVLKTSQRIASYGRFLNGHKDGLPDNALQLRIPVMPLPADKAWRQNPTVWKKYINEVCTCAKQYVGESGAKCRGKNGAENI